MIEGIEPMSTAIIVRLCMIALLLVLIINSLCAMFFTQYLDRYFVFNPHLESSNPYRKLHRFHSYGMQVLLKKPTLKPVPIQLKLWVGVSLAIELSVALIVGVIYIKAKMS
jgi:hypothetical protein